MLYEYSGDLRGEGKCVHVILFRLCFWQWSSTWLIHIPCFCTMSAGRKQQKRKDKAKAQWSFSPVPTAGSAGMVDHMSFSVNEAGGVQVQRQPAIEPVPAVSGSVEFPGLGEPASRAHHWEASNPNVEDDFDYDFEEIEPPVQHEPDYTDQDYGFDDQSDAGSEEELEEDVEREARKFHALVSISSVRWTWFVDSAAG